jgi:hypothetical protein
VEPQDWIALTAVVIGPIAALAGAWVNHTLSQRSRLAEESARSRTAALESVGRMRTLLLDAEPSLVLSGELREFETPEQAVAALYRRWLSAREPLVLLSVTHPVERVQELALTLQAEAEILLRGLHDATRQISEDSQYKRRQEPDDLRHRYAAAVHTSVALGALLSPD